LTPSRLGGPATVADDGSSAFSLPSPALGAEERRAFAIGNAFFKDNWVTAPASTAGRDGLGPIFNARSCSACHLRDGRGRPPEAGEAEATGLLLRLGVPGAGADLDHPVYGGQIQDHAILGVRPEARVEIRTEVVRGEHGDGSPYELQRPSYALAELGYGPLGDGARLGARVAPQMIGLGLLEAIPAGAIEAGADPHDRDADGISGRASHVACRRSGGVALGRFGWKASQATVEEQVAAAFDNDIGITSSLFAAEALGLRQAGEITFVSGGAPELSAEKLARVTFYSQTLAVPVQRAAEEPEVRRGTELFLAAGCGACHTPTWRTGPRAVIPAYAGVEIHPYTDLLLHDLGPELADQKRDGEAAEAEWRTPPLWGIGLFETVNGHTRYLHDGRARNLAEAILWHGGEAEAARERFRALPAAERGALLAFLGSL
jgi:CxxC motif-containing protein (DUF1111 family)